MNEQDLIRRLQEETEATPIPDRLLPEQIAKELSHHSLKKKWYQHPWINMAAAFLLVGIISASVWSINRSDFKANNADTAKNPELNAMEESVEDSTIDTNNETDNPEKSKIQTASDYQQVYQLLSDLTITYSYTDDELFFESDNSVPEELGTQGVVNKDMGTDQARNDDSFYDTNSQVRNVAEADIVKTDGSYIYSCYRQEDMYNNIAVAIAKAEDGTLQSCGIITPESILNEISGQSSTDELKQRQISANYQIHELYIVEQKLILLCGVSNATLPAHNQRSTYILTYDVSNPKAPKLLTSLIQEGTYKSSRLTMGCLYTFTEKRSDIIPEDDPNYETYIPHINQELLACDCIYLPECPDSSCFQVMTGMQLSESDHFVSSKAILSGNGIYYVSDKNIYFAQQKWNCGSTQTELLKFSYEDGNLEPEGSITIDGYLLNQFSMDEYNGYLRAAVTLRPGSYGVTDAVSVSTNALYIIDSEMKLVGKIDDLAPDERIYSVRFMGDTGYFVTYRETDPLFSVDLSDPSDPQVMDALKIPGFSNYLHFYSENLLLGLGEETNPITGESVGLKLSMFDISDPYDIKEIDKTVLAGTYYSPAQYNHKAFMIDPERNLMGFYLEYYDPKIYEYSENYVIYSYIPGSGFEQQFALNFLEDWPFSNNYTTDGRWFADSVRGLYIGNYLYLVNGNCICSYSLDSYQKMDEIQIKADKAGN